MVRIEVDVCAICRTLGRDVQHVEVKVEDRTVFSDVLCEEHLSPVASLLSASMEGGSPDIPLEPARGQKAPSRASGTPRRTTKKSAGKKSTGRKPAKLPQLTEEQARKMGL